MWLARLANDWEAQTSAADICACEISLLNLKAAPFWPKNGLRSNLIASKFHNFFQGRGGEGWGGYTLRPPQLFDVYAHSSNLTTSNLTATALHGEGFGLK